MVDGVPCKSHFEMKPFQTKFEERGKGETADKLLALLSVVVGAESEKAFCNRIIPSRFTIGRFRLAGRR